MKNSDNYFKKLINDNLFCQYYVTSFYNIYRYIDILEILSSVDVQLMDGLDLRTGNYIDSNVSFSLLWDNDDNVLQAIDKQSA